MAKRPAISATEAELRIMDELWRRGSATIRELRDALYPEGGPSKFATVQKLLSRLTVKGFVKRRKQAGTWAFTARAGRDDLIGDELRRVADRLGAQSLTPLLTHLVEASELTREERDHLRKLLDAPADGSTRSLGD